MQILLEIPGHVVAVMYENSPEERILYAPTTGEVCKKVSEVIKANYLERGIDL